MTERKRAKIEQTKIEQICMQVKTEMKRKVGKDPGEGVRNVRKWDMNHLWLPCFKSNRLPMT